MIWLSGCLRRAFDEVLPMNVGWITQPNIGNTLPPRRVWAADNGCFTQPQTYSDTRYLTWLERLRPEQDRCLFATAPDVLGDAAATLDRSGPMLAQIRHLGYPAALVAQDGLEALDVPWDTFDALFIGGTTAWKLSEAAYGLMAAAKRRGKHTHMGRVNSWRRLRAAYVSGYDSADGTFLTFGPDTNLPKVHRWAEQIAAQPPLMEVAG